MAGTGSRNATAGVPNVLPASGNGGYGLVYNSTRNANGSVTPGAITNPAYRFDGITKWTLTKTAVLVETTHSGSQGYQNRKQVVRGGQFKLELVWDAYNLPDSDVTLDQGDEPVLYFKRGLNAGYYRFPAIVETLELTDDEQKDVIRGSVSGYVNGPITNFVPATAATTAAGA